MQTLHFLTSRPGKIFWQSQWGKESSKDGGGGGRRIEEIGGPICIAKGEGASVGWGGVGWGWGEREWSDSKSVRGGGATVSFKNADWGWMDGCFVSSASALKSFEIPFYRRVNGERDSVSWTPPPPPPPSKSSLPVPVFLTGFDFRYSGDGGIKKEQFFSSGWKKGKERILKKTELRVGGCVVVLVSVISVSDILISPDPLPGRPVTPNWPLPPFHLPPHPINSPGIALHQESYDRPICVSVRTLWLSALVPDGRASNTNRIR